MRSVKKQLPSYSRVRELFDYEPSTGVLRWKSGRRLGFAAGCRDSRGYISVYCDGKLYRVHRIIWLWMTGAPPVAEIDHRDLDRSNNRWLNLREATTSQNHANVPPSKRNTSGFKGVSCDRHTFRRKPWKASIRKDGKLMLIGRFTTPEEAHAAYVAKAAEVFGQFARAA